MTDTTLGRTKPHGLKTDFLSGIVRWPCRQEGRGEAETGNLYGRLGACLGVASVETSVGQLRNERGSFKTEWTMKRTEVEWLPGSKFVGYSTAG